jgi:hypothetical protein
MGGETTSAAAADIPDCRRPGIVPCSIMQLEGIRGLVRAKKLNRRDRLQIRVSPRLTGPKMVRFVRPAVQ